MNIHEILKLDFNLDISSQSSDGESQTTMTTLYIMAQKRFCTYLATKLTLNSLRIGWYVKGSG
jgi:hypothetical protein